MIFSKKLRRSKGSDDGDSQAVEGLFEEIEALTEANRTDRDPEVTRRILRLRYEAGLKLVERSPAESPDHPAPAFDQLPDGPGLPEVEAGAVTPELLRAGMLRDGCLLIRGLLDSDEAARLADGIDRAFEARDGQDSNGSRDYFDDFDADPKFELGAEREMVSGGGAGLLGADSPRVMFEVLEAFERAGLQRLATSYLGERTAISVNKSLLRKVSPTLFKDAAEAAGIAGVRPSAWHQDGAFWNRHNGFVRDIRALNVWLSLSRCGDLAPGLDIVPRRLDHIVPTGTDGAVFNWSVSQTVAEEAAGETGILRPIFEPGDALLFDEMFLHSTAAEPEMPNMRHAIESWFFGGSGFPTRYAPLAF